MQATIDTPDTALNGGVDAQYVREGIAALPYYSGKLSEREACETLALGRRRFEEEVLPRFCLSVIGWTAEDVSYEVDSAI